MPVPPGFDTGRSSLLERDLADVIDADMIGRAGQPVLPIAAEGLLGSARAPRGGSQLDAPGNDRSRTREYPPHAPVVELGDAVSDFRSIAAEVEA
eukprot:7017556-Alexandrium_andersonii.AAC.1